MRGEIRSLTGLRGLAALLVIVSHYWYWTRVTPIGALPPSTTPWTGTAFIGMAIFFTLSGYVIALSYASWDWRARPAFNLLRLFFYRFARLYPAYLLFVVLILLHWPQLQDLADPDAQGYVIPHLLLWQTWFPVKFGGELAPHDHFHISWSLSIECALYLAFGLGAVIVAALPQWRFKPIVLGAIFFVLTWALVQAAWSARGLLLPAGWSEQDWLAWLFWYSPYAVSLQFAIGVVAYRTSRLSLPPQLMRAASELGAGSLLLLYFFVGTTSVVPFTQSMSASLATWLVLVGATSDSVVNRLLSGRAIVYIGTISYSLYLFHFAAPPIALAGRSFDTFSSAAAAFHAVNALASFGIAIVIATGVYWLVEVPGRRAIRAAADRALGIKPAHSTTRQGAPAE